MTSSKAGGRQDRPRPDAGLCADCQNAREIRSSRGSVFYLCEYSAIDPAYPKYPRLPVLKCAAYRQQSR
jgi:hypothetical protein